MSVVALLALFSAAVSAGAQGRSVQRLVDRWDGAEGVSVVSIKANVDRLGDVGGVDVSSLIRSISSVTVVSNEKPDEAFARDVRRAVDEGGYTSFMSVSEGGERIEILYGDAPGGGSRDRKELIITIVSTEKIVLISAVGEIDLEAARVFISSR